MADTESTGLVRRRHSDAKSFFICGWIGVKRAAFLPEVINHRLVLAWFVCLAQSHYLQNYTTSVKNHPITRFVGVNSHEKDAHNKCAFSYERLSLFASTGFRQMCDLPSGRQLRVFVFSFKHSSTKCCVNIDKMLKFCYNLRRITLKQT